MSTEASAAYADLVDAMVALFGDLDEGQLATSVPATPEWTVRDVLGHLAGVATDQLADRTEGAPGPEWTGRQVEERRDSSVEGLIGEITGNAPAVQAFLVDRPIPGLLWDGSTHLTDVYEALGLGRPDESLWRPAYDSARGEVLGDRAAAFDGVDDYEVFRAMFARRSRSQLRAMGTGLSDDDLDDVPVFGPRDDDQPQPPA